MATSQSGPSPGSKPRSMAYTSLREEVTDVELKVDGILPDWLAGTFCRVGPALFGIGEEKFKHWFDGQAMLYSYTFENGTAHSCEPAQYDHSPKINKFPKFFSLAM